MDGTAQSAAEFRPTLHHNAATSPERSPAASLAGLACVSRRREASGSAVSAGGGGRAQAAAVGVLAAAACGWPSARLSFCCPPLSLQYM